MEELIESCASLLHKYQWTALMIMVGLLGWIDYATGAEPRFAGVYLIPISFITWLAGRKSGLGVSVLCVAVWFTANELAGLSYSNPWIALWNIFLRQLSFSVFVLVLSEMKEQRERAQHDYLTEIFNKRLFHETANRELARCRRTHKPITIGYVDCDDFKQVNDHHGHEMGDKLLKSVANTIRENLRATDVVARMGGDEFAILLPGTDYEGSAEVFHKVRRQILEASDKSVVPITISMGAVTFQTSPESVNTMLSKADELMYSVKRSGKNNLEHEVVYERPQSVN